MVASIYQLISDEAREKATAAPRREIDGLRSVRSQVAPVRCFSLIFPVLI